MIAYLHVTSAGHGYFAFPTQAGDARAAREGTLNGYGGDVGTLPFAVPSQAFDFTQFSAAMAASERAFADSCQTLGAAAAMVAQ